MTALLVTYDLNKEGQNYSEKNKKVLEIIKKYSNVNLSESSYAISTNENPDDVYAKFKPLLDTNDSLYVITLRKPKMGHVLPSVTKWMDENLT